MAFDLRLICNLRNKDKPIAAVRQSIFLLPASSSTTFIRPNTADRKSFGPERR
jgi:hypothetical protein